MFSKKKRIVDIVVNEFSLPQSIEKFVKKLTILALNRFQFDIDEDI